jgi:ribonuclease E
MNKEMYVSSTPHETKVAVVEDDQLAEIFFERENEYTLAGSIYKGRVTRVLPGMQSAFVDIGLERDAFLYVSDFLDLEEEEDEEFEEVPAQAFVSNKPQPEPRSYDFQKDSRRNGPAPQQGGDWVKEADSEAPEGVAEETAQGSGRGDEGEGFRGGRRRRRGRRGRSFPESKFSQSGREESSPEMAEDFEAPSQPYPPIVLPGESISKYRGNRERAASGEHRNASAPTPQPATESFVIEGGFEDSEPESGSPSAQKPFAEPEGPAQPVAREEKKFVSAPEPARIVLPGESIAKYQRSKVSKVSAFSEVSEVEKPIERPTEAEESLFAKAAPAPVPVAPAVQRVNLPPAPLVLPGESISKYRKKVLEVAEASQDEAVAQPSSPVERVTEDVPSPETEASNDTTESVVAAPVSIPIQETPIALSQSEEEPPKPKQDEPRAEVRMGRSTVAPFILPGESIAKYRRKPQRQAQTLQEGIDHQPQEQLAQEAAEMVASNEPLAITLEREIGSEPAPEAEERISGVPESLVSEHGAVGGTTEPALTSASTSSSEEQAGTEERYEEMNVASTFGGEEVVEEESQRTQDSRAAQVESEAQDSVAFGDEEVTREFIREAQHIALDPAGNQFRHPFAPGEGDLEEEEIDEEDESDYRMYAHQEDDSSDYVELEEETLEPRARESRDQARAANGEQIDANGLTDAIEDEIIDEETAEAAYPTNGEIAEDTGEEFEEEEIESGGAAPAAAGTPEYRRGARSRFDPRRGGRPQRRGPDRGPGGRPMRPGRREQSRAVPLISDLLKEGQEVLIQIAKEPIGKKGARITSHIALPGRFLVYMPTVNHIGVSRKINSDEERQRLKRIMISEREGGHGGFIVRTAAAGIGEDELRADIRFLKTLWADIKHRFESNKAPTLIYHDLNLVERILRDQVTSDFTALWVDTEQEYERLVRFAQRFQPSLVRKIKLYTKNTPLFEQFNIQPELDKALKSKVWLKSGGYIVINQTEALVAIDINTGKYVGKTARLEDTIVKTNVDAIKEIVRQIRLRDLGGIIVIDFIDMDERKNRQKVMQALEEALRADRAPSKVLQFNDFGLVAITRKRVKQSLERTLGEPCSHCEGTGLVKSVTTICNEIYVEMRKMASHLEKGDVMLRVNPEVGKALKAQGGRWMQEMEDMTQKNILIKSDPLLHQEHFDIEG